MSAKIVFQLEQDEDGYPPAGYEGVWANWLVGNQYVLDNIPFFIRDATLGDTVETEQRDDELFYVRTIAESGNSLFRVVYYAQDDIEELRAGLEELGCLTELNGVHCLISINIPPEARLQAVQAFLHEGFQLKRWDYEEAIIRH
jgi:hypothetical protein